MSKHTPGPWAVGRNFSDDCFVVTDEKSEIEIYCEHNSQRTGEANAHLIAAAPDLLVALQSLLDPATNEDDARYYEALKAASAVIAKATGEAA